MAANPRTRYVIAILQADFVGFTKPCLYWGPQNVSIQIWDCLFKAGSVTKIQAEKSKLVSSRQNRRVTTDEVFNLDDLLAICRKVLGVRHRQLFCDLLRNRNP